MENRRDPMRNALAALLVGALTAGCSDGTGRMSSEPSPGGDRYAASDDRSPNAGTLAAVAAVAGLILILVLSDDSSYSSGTLTAG